MSEYKLEATDRSIKGRDTAVLRAEGSVPAVVYGSGIEPKNITIDRNQFVKIYRRAGGSSLVELAIEGGSPIHVLIQDIQLHPIQDRVTHVDFRSIDMNKEIEATVNFEFVGEAAAVKSLGGTLMKSRDSVVIKCLPSKLIGSFEVDLSKLETFDDVIRLGDLDVPEGVELMDDANLMIVGVSAPRTEEEMEALEDDIEENVDAVEKEGEEGEKAEGEEGEGEKAPEGEKEESK